MTKPTIIAISWAYLLILLAWTAAYLLTGDQYGYLGLVNLLAQYLFFPLPLALLAAITYRSKELLLVGILGAGAFAWLWGGLFLPRLNGPGSSEPTLSVMTFNILAYHPYPEPILETIRGEKPDIVLIQELNTMSAEALKNELGEEYPYQVLQAVDDARGIGVISKYPIEPTRDSMPQRWVGGPIFLDLRWNGEVIRVVNFHMLPTTRLSSSQAISSDFRTREEQARLLADHARQAGQPVILGGDANAGPLSEAHRIFTRHLTDAWETAGWGFGHTFPGSTLPGSDRPKIGPVYVPPWLVRIDYIFTTREWQVVEARLAQIDGVSDHRGVIAVLQLID